MAKLTKDACSIPGCGKPHYGRGYCRAHHERLRRHGDPLGGGTSLGEPMRFYREVVLKYGYHECLMWPYSKNSDGYGQLWHDGSCKQVHRLVCEAVNGPAPTPEHQAAHTCGKGHLGCCAPRHLMWKTKADNEADKLAHGTHNRGERNNMVMITSEQALKIRALKGVEPQRATASKFAVSRRTVRDIQTGKKWGWLGAYSEQSGEPRPVTLSDGGAHG